MKTFKLYLKSRIKVIALLLSCMAIFCVIYLLYCTNYTPIIYSLQICAAVFITILVVDYVCFFEKHKRLQSYLAIQEIYKLDVNEPLNAIEADYQEIIQKLIMEKVYLNNDKLNSMTDLKDYYAIWAHQIKTPISAMDLMLQVMEEDPGNVSVKDLKQEMFKIDFYVDAVMNYLRLEDMSSDFIFDTYSFDSIVKRSVKKFSSQFINRHIELELGELSDTVETDEKWLGFIIEQLLSNALKYTKEGGRVRIYEKKTLNVNDRILVVEDNGIGISPEDLPRIMERGYTGYNGRMSQKSSGIGLYLCKKAADKLGIEISFESVVEQGTKVFIDVSQHHTQHE
jgi:signal transduction histidine kinase